MAVTRKKPAPRSSEAVVRPKSLKRTDGERGRQVLRMYAVLRAIESSRFGLTVQQLLEVLEESCALRTVYRDVSQLREAGFPLIESEGRWKLDPNARKATLETFPIQPSEVLALLLSQELASPLGEAGFARPLAALRKRLGAHLTEAGRGMVRELGASVRATLPAPAPLRNPTSVLDAIDEALEREHCLQLDYAPPGKAASLRVVEPHLLWYHGGRAYLAAHCREAGAFRSFALPRIRAATVLDAAFDRRPDFDSNEFVQRGFGVLHGAIHDFSVEFDADVAHLARERRWHASQRLEDLHDGKVRLHFRAAGLPEVAAWLASFGGKVRPLAPRELLDAVRALHEAGLEAVTNSIT